MRLQRHSHTQTPTRESYIFKHACRHTYSTHVSSYMFLLFAFVSPFAHGGRSRSDGSPLLSSSVLYCNEQWPGPCQTLGSTRSYVPQVSPCWFDVLLWKPPTRVVQSVCSRCGTGWSSPGGVLGHRATLGMPLSLSMVSQDPIDTCRWFLSFKRTFLI